jgi:hypothetical protein
VEQFANHAAQRDFGILESNVRYWRKQKEVLKYAKSDSRAFRRPKAGKSVYFMHPNFSAAKLEKKSAQIMRVNTVYVTKMYGTTNIQINIPSNSLLYPGVKGLLTLYM